MKAIILMTFMLCASASASASPSEQDREAVAVVIGVDLSASTAFDGHAGNQSVGIQAAADRLKKINLPPGSKVYIKGLGEYKTRLSKSSLFYEHLIKNQVNEREVKELIQNIFNQSHNSQKMTSIVSFLEFPPLLDPDLPLKHVILISDAYEDSEYGNMTNFREGETLPADAELKGVSLYFTGFGMNGKDNFNPSDVKILRKLWKKFAADVGAIWVRPSTW
jgi:hypothetical protein